MFEFQSGEFGFHFAGWTLRNDGVAVLAVVGDGSAVGAGVIAVVTTVATGEIQMTNVVRMNPPVYIHAGKEIVGVNPLCFDNGLGDERGVGLGEGGILGLVERRQRLRNTLFSVAGRRIFLCQRLHCLFFDVRDGVVNSPGAQGQVNRIDWGMIDVSRAVVAVDAVHHARLGRADLGGFQRAVARLKHGDFAVLVSQPHPRDDLTFLVAGDVLNLVGDRHVPVDASDRTELGITTADFHQHLDRPRRILFVWQIMLECALGCAIEFLRPVALLAGLARRPQVLDRCRDRAGILVRQCRVNLVRAGELRFDEPTRARADVALDARDARVWRFLVSRVLRCHDRVTRLAAEGH